MSFGKDEMLTMDQVLCLLPIVNNDKTFGLTMKNCLIEKLLYVKDSIKFNKN